MAQAQEIRERISGIRDTLKITNAMYLISSTKLNSARSALEKTEPYFYRLEAMFMRIQRHLPEDFQHPFLDTRSSKPEEERRRAVICVTADKGLAGAYNQNVIRLTMEKLRQDRGDMLFVVGEVGRNYFSRENISVDEHFHYTAQNPTLDRARHIASRMLELFSSGTVDEVYIVYTRMNNSLENEACCTSLLPLHPMKNRQELMAKLGVHYEEEFQLIPDASTLLENVVPDFVSGYIYAALVESYCAEQSSRMQAMDAANKNGQELLDELSLAYNRQRQAAITQEITEVAAGARARTQQKERAGMRRMAKSSAECERIQN